MIISNNYGYSLLEAIMAGLIVTIVLLPIVNLHAKIDNLSISADRYNTALYLAQGKLEELKGISIEEVQGTVPGETRPTFNGYSNYSYHIRVKEGSYGLKTVTVTVFYKEMGTEKTVVLTMERR